jgi:site-specific DNA-cytosine methylase
MVKKYNLLELFKGTGSVGKAAERTGKFNVVSVDFDPIYTPNIETDILRWDYKKWYETNKWVPDMIWGSPPCNTFSPMSYRLRERDLETAKPLSDRARMGTALLYRTLRIVSFFKKINPNLLFCLENPRGMMRKDPMMKRLPYLTTTYYCFYGDQRYKPTDFWSNFPLNLKEGKMKSCFKDGRNIHSGKPFAAVQGNSNMAEKYFIPQPLINDILTDFFDEYKGTPHGKTPPPDVKSDPNAKLSREFGETLTTKKK